MPPRRKPTKRKPKPCALGQDFGSSTSKITLAFQNLEHYETSLGLVPQETFHIARVPLRSTGNNTEDPERFNLGSNQSTQQFEFAAFVALNEHDGESELIVGRGALLKDLVIPCKTIFVWLAGIHDEDVLFGLPGGEELRTCLDEEIFDQDDVELAILKHLTLLRDMAIQEAESRNLVITEIVMSYPNYLCERQTEKDPDKKYYNLDSYRTFYLTCMRKVWSEYPDMVYELISEGYSASLYVCEPFDDDNNTLDRKKLWAQVRHLMKTVRNSSRESSGDSSGEGEEDEEHKPKYVKTFVVDTGASSAGFQYQEVFFDQDDELIGSQAQKILFEGTTGGSHLTNQEVRRFIDEDLKTRSKVQPNYAAELLDCYEQTKHLMDPQKNHSIHTLDGRITIVIPAAALQRIFDFAFNGGILLLEQEIDRVASDAKSFILIFCGGSYMNQGLRRSVRDRVNQCQETARRQHPDIEIRCLFLADYDTAPRSAVACGAALAALRRPTVDNLLCGSAIGIQTAREANQDSDVADVDVDQWDKELTADFLFSKGCETLPYVDYNLKRANKKHEHIQFRLVCDPNYYPADDPGPGKVLAQEPWYGVTGLKQATGTTTQWRRLVIEGPQNHLNLPACTYDLGFKVDAKVLPPGTVRFRLLGETAEALMDRGAELGAGETSMEMHLLCMRVLNGREVHHARNKKWRLSIKSDVGAKFLTVDSVQSGPARCCGGCRQDLVGVIQVCRDCENFGLCAVCFQDDNLRHPAGHIFDEFV